MIEYGESSLCVGGCGGVTGWGQRRGESLVLWNLGRQIEEFVVCFRWMGSGLATLILVSKTRKLALARSPILPPNLQNQRSDKSHVYCGLLSMSPQDIARAQVMKIYLLVGFMFCRHAV